MKWKEYSERIKTKTGQSFLSCKDRIDMITDIGAARLLAAIKYEDKTKFFRRFGIILKRTYCLNCKKEIKKGKYCSRKCRGEAFKLTVKCAKCGKTFSRYKKSPQWGNYYCSRKCFQTRLSTEVKIERLELKIAKLKRQFEDSILSLVVGGRDSRGDNSMKCAIPKCGILEKYSCLFASCPIDTFQ